MARRHALRLHSRRRDSLPRGILHRMIYGTRQPITACFVPNSNARESDFDSIATRGTLSNSGRHANSVRGVFGSTWVSRCRRCLGRGRRSRNFCCESLQRGRPVVVGSGQRSSSAEPGNPASGRLLLPGKKLSRRVFLHEQRRELQSAATGSTIRSARYRCTAGFRWSSTTTRTPAARTCPEASQTCPPGG